MRDIDDLKAIALEYGKRQAPSILTKGEGDEAMSIIDAAFDLGLPGYRRRGLAAIAQWGGYRRGNS